MMSRLRQVLLLAGSILVCGASALQAQDADAAREAARARREARRAANAVQAEDERLRNTPAFAERMRLENSLRQALARAVRERLNLNDQQATRLMDVNRKFSDDRLKLAREEMRIRRDLRQSVASGDASRSPATAALLDDLLDTQRQRLELQQKEQDELSTFLSPDQRVRYIGMMEQLRRRIQQRADSARGAGIPPED
jgi:hypothetical protein